MASSTPYSIKVNPLGQSLSPQPRDAAADRQTLIAMRDRARSGDMAGAIALADQAVTSGLEHPFCLNLAALGLEAAGRFEDARARLVRARDLAPGDLGVLNALGLISLRLERFDEALTSFDEALAIDARFAPGHANRAVALMGLGRLLDAEASARRALDLHPGHLAALSALAAISSRRGDHVAARRFAASVLAAEPNHPDTTLSVAAADLAEGEMDQAATSLLALLADPRPTEFERAQAEGLLADVRDAQGRTDEAFLGYKASNDRLRDLYAPRFGRGESTLDVARWMSSWLSHAAPFPTTDTSPPPPTRPEHVFLLGFPRSGTTLLETVLAGHAEVETLEERETLVDSAKVFLATPARLDHLARASEAELAPWREAYWRRAREAGGRLDRRMFVDKHPFNTLKLPLIARLFPEARILVSQRDPRDVVLSCFRRRFQMSPATYGLLSLEETAELYAATMAIALAMQGLSPIRRRVVRHERLIEAFEPEVRDICDFLGLTPDDAMAAVATRVTRRSIATPSGAQLARGINAEGVGYWRRYSAALAPVLPILQPWVERFGYDAT